MPVAEVLRLQEYRDRRSARLRLSQALHAADRRKHEVFRNLSEIAELTGADRAAAVWVDELGSRLVHPYVVVDQLSARPRLKCQRVAKFELNKLQKQISLKD
jgi:hypothetical protein